MSYLCSNELMVKKKIKAAYIPYDVFKLVLKLKKGKSCPKDNQFVEPKTLLIILIFLSNIINHFHMGMQKGNRTEAKCTSVTG